MNKFYQVENRGYKLFGKRKIYLDSKRCKKLFKKVKSEEIRVESFLNKKNILHFEKDKY